MQVWILCCHLHPQLKFFTLFNLSLKCVIWKQKCHQFQDQKECLIFHPLFLTVCLPTIAFMKFVICKTESYKITCVPTVCWILESSFFTSSTSKWCMWWKKLYWAKHTFKLSQKRLCEFHHGPHGPKICCVHVWCYNSTPPMRLCGVILN